MKPMQATSFILAALAAAGAARGAEQAGTPDDWELPMHVPGPYWMVLADRAEAGFGDDEDSYTWDVQGWYGGDFKRLRFKTEGEGEQGESPEDAELQLLFSRLFAPYWEWQLGVRHDFEPGDGRSHLVAGIQGEAPYRFEVDAAVFVSEHGDVSLRAEFEYDLRITQRLVLQPRAELNAALSDVPEFGVESGVNGAEIGLRLRYELRREFAPYLGVAWETDFGGDDPSATSLLLGVRAWF